MNKPYVFDDLSGTLENTFRDYHEEIVALKKEMIAHVLAPLHPYCGLSISRSKASQVLLECFDTAERKFSEVVSQYDVDTWMYLLRRFPRRGNENHWTFYITLGILKYASKEIEHTVLEITLEQVLDAFRLDSLAFLMERIINAHRWVGKGAVLQPSLEDPTHFVASKELENSLAFYDSRGQGLWSLAAEGFLVEFKMASSYPLLLLAQKNTPFRIYEPSQNLYLFTRFVPMPIDAQPVLKILRAYEEPIRDIFKGVSVDSISHVLCATSVLALSRIPPIRSGNIEQVELEPQDNSVEDQEKLDIFFKLCQLGFFRTSKLIWIERLSEITSDWAPDHKRSQQLVEEFLDAFTFDKDSTKKIDLSILRPVPYIYKATANTLYIDITATEEFIAWILDNAKEWYSTQHGDQFTLALKKIVEAQTQARIIGWKEVLISGEKKAEADLLIHAGSTLFVVECKAFAKSRQFIRGDMRAIQNRTNRINQAIIQVEKTVAIIQKVIKNSGGRMPLVERVEGVVCTPTPEYLNPIDKHGMLTDKIPRICTPEELVYVLEKTSLNTTA